VERLGKASLHKVMCT